MRTADNSLPWIPHAINDISAEWLTWALSRRHPGAIVTAMSIGEIIVGTATKVRVHVKYDRIGETARLPPSLIVKAGFRHGGQRHSFVAEMHAYRDLLEGMSAHAPRCFYAAQDEVSGDCVLILEDLVLRDVSFCTPLRPLSFDQVGAFLDMQAQYHARWLGQPALAEGGELGWVRRWISGPLIAQMCDTVASDYWAACLGLPRGTVIPARLRDPERVLNGLMRLAETHENEPQCIVHGDAHLANAYFGSDGEPGYLDWQAARAPWQLDFTYFLVGSLDWVNRRQWERSLLRRYLEQLRAHGAAAPTFEDAWLAYRRDILYGFWVFTICPIESQPETVCTACTARFAIAAEDHQTLELLL